MSEPCRNATNSTDASWPLYEISQAELQFVGHLQNCHAWNDRGLTREDLLLLSGSDLYHDLACAAIRIPAESPHRNWVEPQVLETPQQAIILRNLEFQLSYPDCNKLLEFVGDVLIHTIKLKFLSRRERLFLCVLDP